MGGIAIGMGIGVMLTWGFFGHVRSIEGAEVDPRFHTLLLLGGVGLLAVCAVGWLTS